jgi:hypothetical protein
MRKYQVFQIAFAETNDQQVEELSTTTPDSVECVPPAVLRAALNGFFTVYVPIPTYF